jgi:hypothetical protein
MQAGQGIHKEHSFFFESNAQEYTNIFLVLFLWHLYAIKSSLQIYITIHISSKQSNEKLTLKIWFKIQYIYQSLLQKSIINNFSSQPTTLLNTLFFGRVWGRGGELLLYK